MFARITRLETTPEQHEEGVRVVAEEVLPWVRENTGFRGLIGLAERERGTSLVLSFWADREALDLTEAAADRLGGLTAAGVGAVHRGMEAYEVSLFEVER